MRKVIVSIVFFILAGLSFGNEVVLNPGNINDYGAITSAIATLDASGGGKLRVTAGKYQFTSVPLISNIIIEFEPGVELLPDYAAVPGTYYFLASGTSTSYLKNISILNFKADADFTIAGIINAIYTEDLLIKNSLLSNPSNTSSNQGSLATISKSNNPRVINCVSNNGYYGVQFIETKNALVEGGFYRSVKRDGVLFYNGADKSKAINVTVDGYGLGGETGRAGIHFYGINNGTALFNFIYNGSSDAEALRFRNADWILALGNNIDKSNGAGIAVVNIPDYPDIKSGHGIIALNIIRNTGGTGIAANYNTSNPLIINSNYVFNISKYASNYGDGIGVLTPNSVIANNVVSYTSGNGIIAGGTRQIVSGNIINSVGTGTFGARSGILAYGTHLNLNSNIISQETTSMLYGIKLSASGTATLNKNTVINVTNKYMYLGTVLSDDAIVSSIISAPSFTGQIAIENKDAYIATGVTGTINWE